MASNNIANSRKVLISNLPQNTTSNEIIQELFKSQNFKYNDIDFHGSSAIVTLANANEAKRAAKLINGQLFRGIRISVIEAPPSQKPAPSSGSLTPFLLVGNLSFDFTEKQFKDLMKPHGEIKNAFLVRGKISKKSKGYGFVEFTQMASATRAREHFKKTDAKYIDGRAIRIESVSANVTTGEAKHSRSLFVDKLPKSFGDDEEIMNLFSTAGNVTYCKIARSKEGQPRGYALVDYKTVVDAEKGQEQLDGAKVGDSNIRVSFCPPGKTAEEKFSKFDTPNNRHSGGGRGQLHPVRPGMGGPRGPRLPSLIPRNPAPFLNMGGVGGRPGFPPPGPLRTPFGIGGLPGMPRMQLMRPRPLLLGPGPQLRVPLGQSLLRGPGIRNGHPGVKPGQGVRKNRPNTRPGLATPRPGKKPGSKTGQSATKEKEVTNDKKKDPAVEKNVTKETSKVSEKVSGNQQPEAKKAEDGQTKQEEKPKISIPDSESAEQKRSESAVTATTTQPSEDAEKDLQPVVFMDTEQLKQFRQFQELMKKQKEAEKSGDSKPVSVENLVKVANEENQKTASQSSESSKSSVESKQSHDPSKPQKQGVVSKQLSGQSEPETKLSSAASKFLSPSSKASPLSTAAVKPSPIQPALNKPLSVKPSPAPIKLSSSFGMSSSVSDKHSSPTFKPFSGASKSTSVVSKSSPVTTKTSARPTQSTQQPAQRQERPTKPPHNSYQRPSQPQQRFQAENQKSIKSAGSYEREEKNHNDRNSYQDSKTASSVSRNDSPSSSPVHLPLPPKPSIAANLLQKLFGGKFPSAQDNHGGGQQTNTSKADSRSPHESSYQIGGKSNSSSSEMSRDAQSPRQHSKYGYDKNLENSVICCHG
ncbi:uncharacterized protein LOC114527079 [Dendronephthya gigantea]|uniref:uncharacterized protein LOC114527079 n=1 Tax=Dendronephthya gigantea TaxID=151771 RepID=UPI00106B6896|nr:uncharacterized protein LOC114527079 [Dendronephthya gigantea]XP_028404473.1 uncharacterized protein LOC114527079 [Dendronephthya gigantea]